MINNLQKIKEVCIKVNEKILTRVTTEYGYQHEDIIRLADVLLMIKKEKTKDLISPDLKRLTEFWEADKILNSWILVDDNLEHQTEETINFIAELL